MIITEGNSVLQSIAMNNTFTVMPSYHIPDHLQEWFTQNSYAYSNYDLMSYAYTSKLGLPTSIEEPIQWYPTAMEIVTTLPVVLDYAREHPIDLWGGECGLNLRRMNDQETLTPALCLEGVYAKDVNDPSLGCYLYAKDNMNFDNYRPDNNWRDNYLGLIERVSIMIDQNQDPTKLMDELTEIKPEVSVVIENEPSKPTTQAHQQASEPVTVGRCLI